jgi:hypothetical protein
MNAKCNPDNNPTTPNMTLADVRSMHGLITGRAYDISGKLRKFEEMSVKLDKLGEMTGKLAKIDEISGMPTHVDLYVIRLAFVFSHGGLAEQAPKSLRQQFQVSSIDLGSQRKHALSRLTMLCSEGKHAPILGFGA